MNRVFEPQQFFALPDRTQVAPVLNPWDVNACALPRELLPGASIAVGEIAAGQACKPHLHPIVTQVTWVLDGALQVRMKGARDPHAYELNVAAGSAILTEPMTFLQLVNADETRVARVLYIVTPAYVHLPGADGYDDAVVFDLSWEELTAADFSVAASDLLATARGRRATAVARLGAR
jgi:hypothetical protein